MNVAPGLNADEEVGTAPFASTENVPASRIDFCECAGGQLLVYGWIVHFPKAIKSATLALGSYSVDLAARAIPVRRPDVARHFDLDAKDELHGFYILIDLPSMAPAASEEPANDFLRLQLQSASGGLFESNWPVIFHETRDDFLREPYLTTLGGLAKKLPALEAKRLIEFAGPAIKPQGARENAKVLPAPAEFAIDLCCVLDQRTLIVSGWRLDPFQEISTADLRVGDSTWPLFANSISFARADIRPAAAAGRKGKAADLPGFLFVQDLPAEELESDEAVFEFTAGESRVRIPHPVRCLAHEGRRDLLSFFEKMAPDTAHILSRRIAANSRGARGEGHLAVLMDYVGERAIERLAFSIEHHHPRYSLHLDQAIPVAESMIFLTGWFNCGPGTAVDIAVHSGDQTFDISRNWFRHFRADVASHLAGLNLQSSNPAHGFTCCVPLNTSDAPCYISATTESGETRHLRVVVADAPGSAMQTIRTLLTSFHAGHPELRSLLDRQIGPAVSAAWAGARKPDNTPVIRAYGKPPAQPKVTILVPLYGRYDFATYQIALFAGDPDFQDVELMYVVDDPAILGDFTRTCDDLYGLYRVPFLVVSSGVNLGFAGANNLGAQVARGQYLLFLNSDVMPSRAGWVTELLRTHQALARPGILGTKLLYEDGSVQHAGIGFRRNPGWGNLWINDHPLKGQSPLGLHGTLRVDAVTGACALVEASLFREAGGFSEDYIIGDFEDSDLCLTLDRKGRANYVALDIEMYHLERQSQNRGHEMNWRTNLTLFNCWLHNTRWAETIASRAQNPTNLEGGSSESSLPPPLIPAL